MRYLISFVMLLALTALTHTVIGQGQAEGDGVRRITAAEAREAVAQGKAIIVDVRSQDSYNSGHIKGARWMRWEDIGARVRELPRNKMIITYCA